MTTLPPDDDDDSFMAHGPMTAEPEFMAPIKAYIEDLKREIEDLRRELEEKTTQHHL